MVHFAACIITWCLFLHISAPSCASTAPINLSLAHPVEAPSDGPGTTGAASGNGYGVPENPTPIGATEAGATVPTTQDTATATASAAAPSPGAAAYHPLRRRRDGEDVSNLPDADPPSLWLNSLDSLRCVKQSAAEPGTGACEGPEAWERATDGSRGVYFVAVGDTGLPAEALDQVAATMAEFCSAVPVSFVSLLGDNFYPTGVSSIEDPKFTSHFEIPFGHPALQRVAFFPIFGNHDYKMYPEGQIGRYFSSCATCKHPQDWNTAHVRWRFPNPWYFSRFVYKNVHRDLSAFPVVSNVRQLKQWQPIATGAEGGANVRGSSVTVVNIHLDSNILLSSHGIVREQLAFLEAVLRSAAAEADWIFVHQHHPLFTDGTLCRNIKSFQDLLLPLYLRYFVDAVFAGHEHLLSYFEKDANKISTSRSYCARLIAFGLQLAGPDGEGGTIAQVISGSGSKLHREFPTCCTPSSVHKCKEGQELCRSSNCSFQRTTSGFAVANVAAEEMRLSFIEASTGEVIYHTTRRSKKKIRMQKTATYAGYESVPVAADKLLQRNGGALAYPPISRVSVPLELTGSGWSIDNVPLWEYVVFVLLIVSLLVLAFTCCGRFSCNLKERAVPQARQYSLPSWILRRQTEELDAHELPTILGAVRAVTVGREVELGPRDTRLSVGSLPVVDASRVRELRRQKEQEEMRLV